MNRNKKIAVIKTGWCDTYTGRNPEGNFSYLKDGGKGAERYNMLPSDNGFQVYTMPKKGSAPSPSPKEDWLIYHVSLDPAELKMKLVGWYENATFLGKFLYRGSDALSEGEGYDGSSYCITTERAFEIPAAARPIVEHDGRFKMSSFYWMQGNEGYEPKNSWQPVLDRLTDLHNQMHKVAYAPTITAKPDIGDTRSKLNKTDKLDADDGGEVLGRCRYAESPEHKALKQWAAANAEFFDYEEDDDAEGLEEFSLPSGDSVDAVQITDEYITLIEVKSRRSGEKDTERGIFQCVKYAAVYEAMQRGASKIREVNTVLLTENKVSPRLTTLAKRLGVELKQHRVDE